MPAGTVHGIGKGILVAEIQESSNVTYRAYDYNRVDKNGKKREGFKAVHEYLVNGGKSCINDSLFISKSNYYRLCCIRKTCLEHVQDNSVSCHVYAFSNAVAYLKRNSYIEPTGVKGSYRVIKKKSKSVDESTEEFKTLNKELELKEMREKVKKCVRETYLELEKILDEEKPSVYGRNKHTYEDVTTLIEYMRKFDFIVEE